MTDTISKEYVSQPSPGLDQSAGAHYVPGGACCRGRLRANRYTLHKIYKLERALTFP